jgi:hypothetical protein
MPEELGRLPETTRSTQFAAPIQTNRGWTNLGLRTRPLAVWTFQVTGGTSSPGVNTFNLTVAGIPLALCVLLDIRARQANWSSWLWLGPLRLCRLLHPPRRLLRAARRI